MNIRPKIPMFQYGGNTGVGRTTSDWYKYVHSQLAQHILDMLSKYGEADDYGNWLNDMQHSHSQIRNAANLSGDWKKKAYFNESVRNYQNDYLGNTNNQKTQINENDYFDYNQLGISNAFKNNIFTTPGKRLSGDNPNLKYLADGLYSSITDWRYLLGRDEDWDETSQEFKDWQKQLNDRGWETYKDDSDGYYKLRRLNAPPVANQNTTDEVKKETPGGGVDERKKEDPESPWAGIASKLKTVVPDILDAIRLAGNLNNNERVYNAVLKGIRPNLLDTYRTARLLVGDEATKQGYYRRAAEGETKASQAITSDMDRLIAYLMEAKRIGDEARAQGDLADNAEIRRTGDESNQHQWANILRATEVANRNAIELNAANLAKQNLLALKYASNWSNWDNYLMGIQNKLEQLKLEEKAYLRLLALLGVEEGMLDDEVLTDLTTKKALLYDKWSKSENETEKANYYKQILDLSKEIKKKSIEILRLQLRALMAKSGTKIEYKADDKYLYKTARDVVDHFRKMSKMMDDSRIKSRTKPIKLSSHPKGTRKMQQGGIAPFTVYRPLGIGGQSAVSSQTSSSESSSKSSKKDNAEKDKLDAIKKLFEVLTNGKGLPTDVNSVYKDINLLFLKSKLFGEEMSTDDIASLYLNSIQKISNLKYSLDNYDKILQNATAREALDEYAVTADGRYIVLNRDTKDIEYASSLLELKEKNLNPITNRLLLYLRAYSPDLALYKGDDLVNNVDNGMGINKIGAQIKALAGNIGTTEGKLEGISLIESGKVRRGLEMLAEAPDGHYKVTTETKSQQEQVDAALSYIENMLSPSQKAILNIHGGVRPLIKTFLTSLLSVTKNVTISPLTGKASDKNSNGSGEKGDSNNSAGLAFVLGLGPKELISFNTGTSNEIEVLGIKGVLLTKSNENLGQGSTLQDATKSLQGGYLLWNKATFGGSKLNSSAYSHIILNDSTILGVDLPYTEDINGNEVPNFLMLRKMELADEDIRQNNITDTNLINLIYIKYGLDPKYTPDGKLNLLKYKRFAAIQATLDELSLQNKEAILSDEVALAGEVERDLYKEIMKKSNKDYDLDDGTFGYFKDNLYKGTIFIPYSEDIAFAALSSGLPFNLDLPNNVTTIQEKLYAPKISQYVSPQVTLSLVKNN